MSRQLLGWQLVIVAVLVAAVGLFSGFQATKSFRDTEGRRMLSIAEDVAATLGVRTALADPLRHHQLPTFAESARSLSGAAFVIIADPSGKVLTSPDPAEVGEPLPLGDSMIESGRSWVGGSTPAAGTRSWRTCR